MKIIVYVGLICSIFYTSPIRANEYPVGNISVIPILFVPIGKENSAARWTNPDREDNIYAYVDVTQKKWRSMLGGTPFTFDPLKIVYGSKTSSDYIEDGNAFFDIRDESFLKTGHPVLTSTNACNLNKIFFILVLGGTDYTAGSGLNYCSYAMHNSTGVTIVGIDHFYKNKKLTSTIVHELGHALGIPHTWERPNSENSFSSLFYSYGRETSTSVMSYNPANQSNSIYVNEVPGNLLPLERFELSYHKRALPYFHFNGAIADFDLLFSTFFQHPISPISNSFNIFTMWRSPNTNELGWVSFDYALPKLSTVNEIHVYTGESNYLYRANAVQIEVRKPNGQYQVVDYSVIAGNGSTALFFPKTQGQHWKIALRGSPYYPITVRGVRMFHNFVELYPPQ